MVDGYTTDLLATYSVEFIKSHRAQPFFLYVPHLAIHFPWQGPDDPPHRRKGRSYHDDKWGVIPDPGNVQPHVQSMIRSLDDSVGDIVAAVKKWELERNTLIIFTSDNGGYLTYGDRFRNISSNGPLRGAKGQLYEGGHRVPAIFSWRGRIVPTDTAATAHSVDLLPTLASIAGIDEDSYATDGVDLGPLLFHQQPLKPRMLFWRAGQQRAVRSGPWKLFEHGDRIELFHLGRDLAESRNLSSERPETVQNLRTAWSRWEADVNRSAKEHEK